MSPEKRELLIELLGSELERIQRIKKVYEAYVGVTVKSQLNIDTMLERERLVLELLNEL